MDLISIIEELRREKDKLDWTIASLEELEAAGEVPVRRRPGRKSMSPEERREVSARMKKYWADLKRREALERGTLRVAAVRLRRKSSGPDGS